MDHAAWKSVKPIKRLSGDSQNYLGSSDQVVSVPSAAKASFIFGDLRHGLKPCPFIVKAYAEVPLPNLRQISDPSAVQTLLSWSVAENRVVEWNIETVNNYERMRLLLRSAPCVFFQPRCTM